MNDEKEALLKLCEELSKPIIDASKVKLLLLKTTVPYSPDPFELTNRILKALHPYQESS